MPDPSPRHRRFAAWPLLAFAAAVLVVAAIGAWLLLGVLAELPTGSTGGGELALPSA